MYELLKNIAQRPKPFSQYTVMELWTSPYLAQQMLSYHLNQETDLASRRFESIDQVVSWIDSQLNLTGKHICDLGCGPGLYTQRFSQKGAYVTGVDFSVNSLGYAREEAMKNNHVIDYIHANYLTDDLPSGFDIITLIYTDLSVLSPQQRAILLGRMRKMLNPNGRIVIDVAGMNLINNKEEITIIENRLMYGFWAKGDYVGIQRSFVYREENISLDRYLIVEPNKSWEILNWFQHFTPESIQSELSNAGFTVDHMTGGLAGELLNSESDLIGVIASVA